MNLLKRHKWVDVKKFLSNYDITHKGRPLAPGSRVFGWKKCKNCNLQKVTTGKKLSRIHREYKTFYFELDEDNNIIEGGPETQTVPYGCGYKEKVLLTDDDFAIEI